jgi:hypothetical protein
MAAPLSDVERNLRLSADPRSINLAQARRRATPRARHALLAPLRQRRG